MGFWMTVLAVMVGAFLLSLLVGVATGIYELWQDGNLRLPRRRKPVNPLKNVDPNTVIAEAISLLDRKPKEDR
jgi:hypothetical protein